MTKGRGELRSRESAETYLETILVLSKTKGEVRSIDIANELDYTKPSVSVAMRNLRESGHIVVDEAGYITLTESGRKIAETMDERHQTISCFLIALGVDEKTATKDACRIEHIISNQSFEKISEHFRILEQTKRTGPTH